MSCEMTSRWSRQRLRHLFGWSHLDAGRDVLDQAHRVPEELERRAFKEMGCGVGQTGLRHLFECDVAGSFASL